jgi:hypothetical protein
LPPENHLQELSKNPTTNNRLTHQSLTPKENTIPNESSGQPSNLIGQPQPSHVLPSTQPSVPSASSSSSTSSTRPVVPTHQPHQPQPVQHQHQAVDQGDGELQEEGEGVQTNDSQNTGGRRSDVGRKIFINNVRKPTKEAKKLTSIFSYHTVLLGKI